MKINWSGTLSSVAALMFVFDSAWMLGYVFRLEPVDPRFYFTGLPVTIAYPLLGGILILSLTSNNKKLASRGDLRNIRDTRRVRIYSIGIPNAIPTALYIAATVMHWYSRHHIQ